MNILIGCERSGIVREAFRAHGHNAISCDIVPAEDGRVDYHYEGDVLDLIDDPFWDMGIFFPDCTYVCSSGLHWNKRRPERQALTDAAVMFDLRLMNCRIPKIAMENPIGCLSTKYRKPNQIIQPYQFGEDASKATCLWLKGLPLLKTTNYIQPRVINGKKRWANQTDSGQNKLAPSQSRAMDRARTYVGIAQAMAEQWSL